jgi:formylglycine-generating enzyme required for sulfatase activity
MLGNVWQWCQNWFGPYSAAPSIDPQGALSGDRHPTRGGCFTARRFTRAPQGETAISKTIVHGTLVSESWPAAGRGE